MSGRLKATIPLLIILSIFAVMACHFVHGPYTVVNGPSTAFLSVKNAQVVHLSIETAGLMILIAAALPVFTKPQQLALSEEPSYTTTSPGSRFCTLLC
jgi:hypothetical protein